MIQEQPRSQGSPDYAALLRQYGEVMLKIGQLEAQVHHLTQQLQGITERESRSDGLVRDPSEIKDIAGKVEALEKLVVDSSKKTRESETDGSQSDVSRAEDARQRQQADEIRQLKVRISSMASQLANTEGQLAELGQGRVRRRRHTAKSARMWKSLRRRIGLG